MKTTKLLSISQDAKTIKGQKKGYLTAVMYLAPYKLSGVMNTCPSSSEGCRVACLFTAGRSSIPKKDGSFPIQEARIRRTQFLKSDRTAFLTQLEKEINAFIKKAERMNLIPTVRLNGTSDLAWEHPVFGIMQKFPDIIFYDYSKIPKRALAWAKGEMPSNYHLTFSWNEETRNHEAAAEIAKAGGNVAVVFSSPDFPETFLGLPVINGDENDLRFTDPKGCIVGLKAKGKAKKDKTSGFVVQVA